MKIKKDIQYHSTPYGFIATIPKGTSLIPATNLPNHKEEKLFWAKEWQNMSDKEKSWMNNYGFLIKMK
jgi:hypothetical protein